MPNKNKTLKFDDLKPGLVIRHKKGGLYQFVGTATHTERDDGFLALYKSLGPSAAMNEIVWARPMDMFLDGRFQIEEIKVV